MATTVFERPSTEFDRKFWSSASSMTVSLAADQKTYIAWCAPNSNQNMMHSEYGAIILVSNGYTGCIHKGTAITINVNDTNQTMTINSSSPIAMGLIEV